MGLPQRSWWLMLVLMAVLKIGNPLPEGLRIGAMFEPEYEGQWRALKWAVEDFNLNPEILNHKVVLVERQTVNPQDSFTAQKTVCKLTQMGIAAMFGPVSPLAAEHVQSICTSLEIPQIQWRWDPRDSRDYFSISLYPHYLMLSAAYSDAVRLWGWKRYTILYDSNEGLTRIQEVLKESNGTPSQVTVRKLRQVNNDYVELLNDLKNRHEDKLLIDCNIKVVKTFLHAALKLEMLSRNYHYFFTTLDLGLLDLRDYLHGGANITGYRLIDPDNKKVVKIKSDWLMRSRGGYDSPLMEYTEIETETALAYDAYELFARALHSYPELNTLSLPCDKEATWAQGTNLLNHMKATKFEGLSGPVSFDGGERLDFQLDLMFIKQSGLIKAGTWDRHRGLNFTMDTELVLNNISGHKYIVSTYLTPPYVIELSTNPPKYSGICVEILDLIAKAKNFTYEIKPQKTVGKQQADGSWDGVMGALIRRDAHIGIGDLTINLRREKVVDFTKPYLTTGITILIKKPIPKSLNLFSFLSPLSADVWVYMIAAYLCVSFMLFVIARFSPYEWCNPHPCNPDLDEVENQFTIMNSLWFTIGSLMQQGCEISPRALSTRMVAGMWWFFTLIMISSYTANLAAFLTVERMDSEINSADDLAKQTKIKYGLYEGGATSDFFRNSRIPTYTKMWTFMNSTPELSFVKSSKEATERALRGDYAYIAESTTVEYIIHRNCDLMKVGGLLDSKGYGFATPQVLVPTHESLREALTEEILRLQEEQVIDELYTKWWKQELGGGQCVEEEGTPASKAAELGVENVGGVFVVLMGGVVGGFFISLCEFTWKARKNARRDKQTLCSEMSEEFRFAVRCLGSKRSHKKPEDEIIDNGLQFMPLTGYTKNPHDKEVYA